MEELELWGVCRVLRRPRLGCLLCSILFLDGAGSGKCSLRRWMWEGLESRYLHLRFWNR